MSGKIPQRLPGYVLWFETKNDIVGHGVRFDAIGQIKAADIDVVRELFDHRLCAFAALVVAVKDDADMAIAMTGYQFHLFIRDGCTEGGNDRDAFQVQAHGRPIAFDDGQVFGAEHFGAMQIEELKSSVEILR